MESVKPCYFRIRARYAIPLGLLLAATAYFVTDLCASRCAVTLIHEWTRT